VDQELITVAGQLFKKLRIHFFIGDLLPPVGGDHISFFGKPAAQIEHYDSRAKEEVKDLKASKPKTTSAPKQDTTPAKPTGDEAEEPDTEDTKTNDDDTGGFDF
jgi:hypothetical protein